MYSLGSLIILGPHCVAILVAKMLVWVPFSRSMSVLSFCINQTMHLLCLKMAVNAIYKSEHILDGPLSWSVK